jgi:1,4-alpha-glucan branching enzyme
MNRRIKGMRQFGMALLLGLVFSLTGCDDSEVMDRVLPYKILGSLGGSEIMVKFNFDEPTAREVWLIGDFNNWAVGLSNPFYPDAPLSQGAKVVMRMDPTTGFWTVTIPLVAGRYMYQYAIDQGIIVQGDPNNADKHELADGTFKSVVYVIDK